MKSNQSNASAASPATRERELFLAALEQEDSRRREEFLRTQCGADQGLRARIESLLAEHESVGDFLEAPALQAASSGKEGVGMGPTGTVKIAEDETRLGERIGPYKLLQSIGEGGCGVVYMVEQESPVRRRVALKVIKLGMDTRNVIARFEAERQALALMDHPNIAKVLDAGATPTGRPYFVMELVRGIRITDYCDQNQLCTEDRLKLFIRVCQAIQHAHQKGVIHRDIKPSNILVTLHDGVPVPKVIDFGIAKATEQRLTDKTLFTEFRSFIGTPAYMSPEQAEMSGLDIDTRSDIYSLGVLLYELLVGITPFDPEVLQRAGVDECRRTIREDEPMRPSTRLGSMVKTDLTTAASQRREDGRDLISLLKGDLDWIVMKCLEKDRTRRYETASALATDIQHLLANEPVEARPPSNWYRIQKMYLRHRVPLVASVVVLTTVLVGSVVSVLLAVRATHAEHAAQAARDEESRLRKEAEADRYRARLNEYVADINLAQQSLADGNYGRATQLLGKHRKSRGDGDPDLRGFEWAYLNDQSRGDPHTPLMAVDQPVHSMAISPDGEWLAVANWDRFRLLNLKTRMVITNLPPGGWDIAFLSDNRRVAYLHQNTVHVYDFREGKEERKIGDLGPGAGFLVGDHLMAVSWGPEVRWYDTTTWLEVQRLAGVTRPLTISRSGHRVVSDSREGGLSVWSTESGRIISSLQESTNLLGRFGFRFRTDRTLAISPDGRLVAAARNTLSPRGVFVLSLWDAETGKELAVMPSDVDHVEHSGRISEVVFSSDGKYLLTSSLDHSVRLWDVAGRQLIRTFQGHTGEVWSVAFLAGDEAFVSGGKDGDVKLWPVQPPPRTDLIDGVRHVLAMSKDGQLFGGLSRDGTMLSIVRIGSRTVEQRVPIQDGRIRFTPWGVSSFMSQDLRWFLYSSEDGRVRKVNLELKEITPLNLPEAAGDPVSMSGDLEVGITRHRSGSWSVWNPGTGQVRGLPADASVSRAQLAPSGKVFVTLGNGYTNAIQLWDTGTLNPKVRLDLEESVAPGLVVAFSKDETVLAVAHADDVVRLWDVVTGKLLGSCVGHKQGVRAIAFSGDGRTLATAGEDSNLKLWNVKTQLELLSIRQLGATLNGLNFSSDGQWLIGGSGAIAPNGGVRVFAAPR